MKRFFQFLFAMTLIMSAQGCSNDSTEDPTNSTSVELRLKGYIKTIETTRVNADGFEVDDKVGVYVSATGSLSQQNNTLDNEAYTYSNGNLIAPVGKEAYWGSEDVRLSVWAYYPYAQDIENNAAYQFAVNDNQSTEEAFYNSDFITASATNLAPQTTPVELTFNHVLSKIDITLIAGDGITTEELTTATKSYSIKNLATSGTINLETGVATASTTSSDIIPLATDGLNYSAIVYPQSGNITLRLEMNDNIYTYSTNVTYQAGYSYKYTLKINVHKTQEMALEAIAINPWNNGETTEGEMTQITPDKSDIIQFSDSTFKATVLNSVIYDVYEDIKLDFNIDPSFGGVPSGYRYAVTTNKIDANHDGEISILEAENVTFLEFSRKSITNLSDTKYFPNLRYLGLNNTKVSELDVTNNTKLEYLNCDYSSITTLDLSKNTNLLRLDCHGNAIETLDLSKNLLLETFWGTIFKNLNLSNLKNLTFISISSCPLSTLDISGCTALTTFSCGSTELQYFDASGCSALTTITLNSYKLATLDTSDCTALTSLNCANNKLLSLDISGCTALTSLNCANNQLSSLDISGCTALTSLNCSNNQLSSLDVSNCTDLLHLQCEANKLSSIDVSACTNLTTLWFGNNSIKTFDVSRNTQLNWISCESNQIENIDISKCVNLTFLECYDNLLSELNISNNIALTDLICYNNLLSSLDTSSHPNLISLNCFNNQISSLDLSNNNKLGFLTCYANQLSSLTLSNCTNLRTLECYNNNLTSLDLSDCTGLSSILCENNKLSSLDLTSNTLLTDISCNNNYLTSLDISSCTNLLSLSCSPMDDAEGYNLLETIYMTTTQNQINLIKPIETVIEYK